MEEFFSSFLRRAGMPASAGLSCHYVRHDKKSSSASSARFSTLSASQFDTHSSLTQSVTSAVHNEQFN